MFKSGSTIVYWYAQKHWPSRLPKSLVATSKEVQEASEKAVQDFKRNVTQNGILVRLAGQSGSGKTTQLLPAALEFYKKQKMQPVIIAARDLAKYHPHYEEILKKYGEGEVRKRTDDFATILMYLVVDELTKLKCDMIIDLSFVSIKVEKLLIWMTKKYTKRIVLLMAVIQKKAEDLLQKRAWRHTNGLEAEFLAATGKSLKFYGKKCSDMRVVMWSFDKLLPIYDGTIDKAYGVWKKELNREQYIEKYSVAELKEAKKRYFSKNML